MPLETRLWRPRVREIVPYEPGKPIEEVVREFGVTDVVKLASNENPLGPSPKARAAAARALDTVHLYPDAAAWALREALAARLGIPSDHLLPGNGTAEIIEIVTEAFLGPGDIAVTGDQAFFKYRIAVQIMDGRLESLPMPDMAYDIDAIVDRLRPTRGPAAKVVFLANPNNPTGLPVSRSDVDRIVAALGPDQLLVLDEAYYEFIERDDYPQSLDYIRQGANVVVLRTFSKAYGLAGLRVGFAVARPDVLRAMWKVKEAFNTNAVAQAAALAALDDEDHLRATLALNGAGKARLYDFCDDLGLRFWRSETNFVLVDLAREAQPVFDALLRRGVIVRPLRGYLLPTCIRVSVGTPREMERFERALTEVLADG